MVDCPVLWNDWHAVVPVKQLDETGIAQARLLGEDIVIWRTGDQVFAWQDLCLHRGARLSLGEIHDETLMCPYHGWTYNTEGRCVKMPAHPDQKPSPRAVVKTYHAQVCYDMVWVCMGEPQHEIPPFPEWQDTNYRRVLCGPYPLQSAGQRMIENFLDVAHFPWVHENILGDRERAEIGDYEITVDETGVAADDIEIYQPNPDGTRVGKLIRYHYKVHRPLIAYFRKESSGPGFAMMLMMTPVEAAQSVIWQWMLLNHSHDAPEEELLAFQDEIVYQDLPVVESQRPGLLPSDLQAELHLRSDKVAIAYRQWLNDLGVRFGMT